MKKKALQNQQDTANKNSSKREVYSDTGLFQETITNKQPHLPPKGIKKRTTKSKVSRKEGNEDQRGNK